MAQLHNSTIHTAQEPQAKFPIKLTLREDVTPEVVQSCHPAAIQGLTAANPPDDLGNLEPSGRIERFQWNLD
jgi:hypothetical protein